MNLNIALVRKKNPGGSIRHFIFLNAFLLFSFTSFSQTKWGEWSELYKDQSTTVKIQFKQVENGCESGKSCKFRCQIEGKLKNREYFVNWKMDYMDCDGNRITQNYSISIGPDKDLNIPTESMSYIFKGDVKTPYYDVKLSERESAGTQTKEVSPAKDPDGIDGVTSIYVGESTKLSVKGGTLGAYSQWVWYEDTCCGVPIHRGPKLTVTPVESRNYFVRAEGSENSAVVSVLVNVDQRSRNPMNIAGKATICKGEQTTLSVMGGSLGADAKWVWYANTCGGVKTGEGAAIQVNPLTTTKYFVRAEGKTNATSCAEITVTVNRESRQADFIKCEKEICVGEKVYLEVAGGNLSADAEWKWYTGKCDGKLIATGKNTTVVPQANTTYYVKAEGQCNVTNCVSASVVVSKKSTAPLSIRLSGIAYKNRRVTLSVQGGSLGTAARWNWYKGSCSPENKVGTGDSLRIKVSEYESYYVRAEGKCNETYCIGTSISPRPFHKWNDDYAPGKIMHSALYLGIGTVFLNGPSYGTVNKGPGMVDQFRDSMVNISGMDLALGYDFHPVMTDYFSLGFHTGLAFGNVGAILSNNKNPYRPRYSYSQCSFGTEVAVGIKPIKLLGIYQAVLMNNSYQKTTSNTFTTNLIYDENFVQENIGVGLRILSYNKVYGKYGSGRGVDITYNFCRQGIWGQQRLAFLEKKNDLSHWNSGVGVTWWLGSQSYLQGSISTNGYRKSSNSMSSQVTSYFFKMTLVVARNRFY